MAGKNEKKKVGLRFKEKMSGYLARGVQEFTEGEKLGKIQNTPISFEVSIQIEDVADFCKLAGRKALLAGTISWPPGGANLPIREGEFTLFRPDAGTGKRQMVYSFRFTGQNGAPYFFHGYKVIHDDPGPDMAADLTCLYARIFQGDSPAAPLFGSGILRFALPSLPSMLASFEVTGASSLTGKLKALSAFYSFCYGELRDTYLRNLSPFYHTSYENLVLNGQLAPAAGDPRSFFFFSGVHDKDFPWGDDEVFWDVALAIEQPDQRWRRYVLTDRLIDGLELDVRKGYYRYEGPLYELLEGHQVWRSELRQDVLPSHLRRIPAEIEIRFEAQKYSPVNVPFSRIPDLDRLLSREEVEGLREWLPHLEALGLQMTPHRVRILEGQVALKVDSSREVYSLVSGATAGEAETSTLHNVRWPKLYYHYFCALDPASGETRVQVRTDALRTNRRDILLDKAQAALGRLIRHMARLDLVMKPGAAPVLTEEKENLRVAGTILEINNDHFPTAVFQRRIAAVRDEAGALFHALEEEMDTLNLGSIHSDRVVTVAAVKGKDKLQALDEVLRLTDFLGRLEAACARSGKSREEFAILVKPNFMFMYSIHDPSTYTDPQLIEHLLDRIFERGYRNLAVGDARSTYGVFFTNREVRTVARHIGLAGKNYRIIDLSEDLVPHCFSGKLGEHFVNREWKAADFRISFAKNKTHAYAVYTLALKNVYGALPMENKFLEYHHRRDIFTTTIEFLRHFPVHFAFIDAWISADGPFGVFADKRPNVTGTVIGSEDLIAADWIGASKMGLDPMASDYMKLAVEAFGKPQIRMAGDRSLYPDWVNVTDLVPLIAFGALDRHYYFGNLFYSVFGFMEDFFQYKDPGLGRRIARALADPLKSLFFRRVGEGSLDTAANREFFELLHREAKEERGDANPS